MKMKVFCNIFCEFQWNSTIYPTRRFLELRIQVKHTTVNIQKTTVYTLHLVALFLARSNNGTGPLISILLRLIFMLTLFCIFAWWPINVFDNLMTPKFQTWIVFSPCVNSNISFCNLDHHSYHNPLYHQLQLSCVELFSLWIFSLQYQVYLYLHHSHQLLS